MISRFLSGSFTIFRNFLKYVQPTEKFICAGNELRYDMFHYMVYNSDTFDKAVLRLANINCDQFQPPKQQQLTDAAYVLPVGIFLDFKDVNDYRKDIGSYCVYNRQLAQIEKIYYENHIKYYDIRVYVTDVIEKKVNENDIQPPKLESPTSFTNIHDNYRNALLSNILQMVQTLPFEKYDIRHLNSMYNYFYGVIYLQNSLEICQGSIDELDSIWVGIRELSIAVPINYEDNTFHLKTHNRVAELGVFVNGKHIFGKTICLPTTTYQASSRTYGYIGYTEGRFFYFDRSKLAFQSVRIVDIKEEDLKPYQASLFKGDNLLHIKWQDHVDMITSEPWVDVQAEDIQAEIRKRITRKLLTILSNPTMNIRVQNAPALPLYKEGLNVHVRDGEYGYWIPGVVTKIVATDDGTVSHVDILYKDGRKDLNYNVVAHSKNIYPDAPKYKYFGISKLALGKDPLTFEWGLFSEWDDDDAAAGNRILHTGFRLTYSFRDDKQHSYTVTGIFDLVSILLSDMHIDVDDVVQDEAKIEEKIVHILFRQHWTEVEIQENKSTGLNDLFEHIKAKHIGIEINTLQEAFAESETANDWTRLFNPMDEEGQNINSDAQEVFMNEAVNQSGMKTKQILVY